MTCAVCRVAPALNGPRCSTCARYRRRTGRDRSPELVDRMLRRRTELHGLAELIRGITSVE